MTPRRVTTSTVPRADDNGQRPWREPEPFVGQSALVPVRARDAFGFAVCYSITPRTPPAGAAPSSEAGAVTVGRALGSRSELPAKTPWPGREQGGRRDRCEAKRARARRSQRSTGMELSPIASAVQSAWLTCKRNPNTEAEKAARTAVPRVRRKSLVRKDRA
jgi:hypothetical protein